MQRFLLGSLLVLAVAVVSIMCGIGGLAVSIIVSMCLGVWCHGNYEYHGSYGYYDMLILSPTVAGLLVPWLAAWMIWVVRRRNKRLSANLRSPFLPLGEGTDATHFPDSL